MPPVPTCRQGSGNSIDKKGQVVEGAGAQRACDQRNAGLLSLRWLRVVCVHLWRQHFQRERQRAKCSAESRRHQAVGWPHGASTTSPQPVEAAPSLKRPPCHADTHLPSWPASFTSHFARTTTAEQAGPRMQNASSDRSRIHDHNLYCRQRIVIIVMTRDSFHIHSKAHAWRGIIIHHFTVPYCVQLAYSCGL